MRNGVNSLTFPIIARPRPPLGAHSSLATFSSFCGRLCFMMVVTGWPLTMSVYGGNGLSTTTARSVA